MNIKKIAAGLLGITLVALTLGGCSSTKKVSGQETQLFETKNEVVEKSKEIIIDNSSVKVNIVANQRKKNDIEAYLHGKMLLEEGAVQPKLNISTEGDKVILKVEKDSKLDAAIKESSLVVDIYVPDTYKETVSVKSTSGNVIMSLPETVEFTLNAKTASGEIKNTLPITVEGEQTKTELKGKVKSGATKINIEVAEGNIELNQSK
ncbi:DUF4097 family beta strand repeat-containing protein [Clostridium ganghwense]|uniref:DUF4097 family beta strand repeat-containing protein n=1 Tax=Clostridium ganghwense TaxID=312089 RepID=A0ABT4CQW4_9CLOT|nr:DUF4097 family beta strand repeat-containing protein [Clostridium ganghwense]MCY6371447.1 DUF4097 family beta strand repeat-containing protein [Clostridium ganghwense]